MSCPNCYRGNPGWDGGPDGPPADCAVCSIPCRLTYDDFRLLKLAISRECCWTAKNSSQYRELKSLQSRLDHAQALLRTQTNFAARRPDDTTT